MNKYALFFVSLVTAFIFGYNVCSYKNDSVALIAQRTAERVGGQFQDKQKDIASEVITSLDDWKNSNRGMNETIIREKVKPVFYVDCVSPEYLRLFNDTTNNYQRQTGLSGKPAEKAGN